MTSQRLRQDAWIENADDAIVVASPSKSESACGWHCLSRAQRAARIQEVGVQQGFPTERLDRLEERVSPLETLPAKVEALAQQILLLRTEMRSEFSAMRAELRAELRAEFGGDMRELRARIDDLGVQMRVLHEDVINRIALLGEAMNGTHRKGRRRQ